MESEENISLIDVWPIKPRSLCRGVSFQLAIPTSRKLEAHATYSPACRLRCVYCRVAVVGLSLRRIPW